MLQRVFLCNIKKSLRKIIDKDKSCNTRSVYLSTKALKHVYDRHVYDKNTPEDFAIILENITNILKYPDKLFKNLVAKRGDILFVKEINQRLYYCSIEIAMGETGQSIEIVSLTITGEKYLKKFTLLWSWRTATPPS